MAFEEIRVPQIVGIEEADEGRARRGEPAPRGAGLADVLVEPDAARSAGRPSSSSVCCTTAAESSVEASSTITQSKSRRVWRADRADGVADIVTAVVAGDDDRDARELGVGHDFAGPRKSKSTPSSACSTVLEEQAGIAAAAARMRRRRLPGLAPRRQLLGVDMKLEPALGHVEGDAVAGLDQGERPADRRFGRDVQHDGAEGRAAHARVGDADHVLHAGARELHGDGERARLGHAGRPFGPALRSTRMSSAFTSRFGIVAARGKVLQRIEHHGAAGMGHQRGRGGRVLDDRAARREVAAQHRHAAGRLDRILRRADHGLAGHHLGGVDHLLQRVAGDRLALLVEVRADLLHQARVAAGPMEMLHVVVARRLEVDQHRHLAADLVELLELDVDARGGAPRR